MAERPGTSQHAALVTAGWTVIALPPHWFPKRWPSTTLALLPPKKASLPARPSDDGRERINELYELIYLAVPLSEWKGRAALDELRDTALTLHAALVREDLSPANRTGS